MTNQHAENSRVFTKKSHGSRRQANNRETQTGTSKSTQRVSYHGKSGEAIRVHDGVRQIVVGMLYPDGEFVKRVKPEHILRTPPSISIQAAAVKELVQRGCTRIRADIVGGKSLLVSCAVFLQHGFLLNRGFGEQIALPLSQWQPADAVQGSLFEEVFS